MPYLVSFCNLGSWCSRYALGFAEDDLTQFSWLNADSFISPEKDQGVTGIAAFDGGILVCVQSIDTRVVWLDPDLRLRQTFRLREAKDLHSITVRGYEALIASSANNRLFSLDLNTGIERCVFAAHAAEVDIVHRNGVAMRDGHALVSMFGEETREGKRLGCVIDIDTNQVVADAISEPHSPVVAGEDLYVLGSAEGKLYRFGQGQPAIRSFGGYLRGLSVTSDSIVVGRSGWRAARRQLGGLRKPPEPTKDPHGNAWQRSAFIRVHRASQLIETADASSFGPEIYDIVRLQSAPSAAPLLGDAAHRRIDALQEAQVRLSNKPRQRRP